MKCHEFDDRLQQLLDDRLPLRNDAALLAHAHSCADCIASLVAYESLVVGTRALIPPSPSPGFTNRVVERLQSETTVARPSDAATGRIWIIWAAAAALLLAVTIAGIGWRLSTDRHTDVARGPNEASSPTSQERTSRGTIAALNPGRGRHARTRAEAAQLQESSLAEATSRPHQAESSDAAGQRSLLYTWAYQFPATVEQIDSFQEYTPGIRPIRASFTTAIDALRRTLPGQGEQPSRSTQTRSEAREISIA